jgi:hypothetical protein
MNCHECTNELPRMHELNVTNATNARMHEWGAFVQLVGLLHSPFSIRLEDTGREGETE